MSKAGSFARAGTVALLAAWSWQARADTDYSLYGVADLSYGRFEPSGSIKDDRVNSNSLSASFVGVNAKDSLDGGWTPGITLETFLRFQDFATGRKDSDPLLSRKAYLSLGTPAGEVRAGRLQTLLFDTTTRFNALGNSVSFSPALRALFFAGNLEGVQGDFYWDRGVSYHSPDLAGVTVNAMYALGSANRRGDYAASSVVWELGLLASAVSVQRVHINNGIDDPTVENTWQLDTTYNFGVARLFGQYSQTNDIGLGVRGRIASLGAAVPIGPGTFEVQAALSTAKGIAVDRKHTSASAAYVYAWDSLTDVYVAAMDDRVRGQTRGVSAAAGVRVRFE